MHLPIKHQCTHIEIKLWIIINFMHIDILPPNSCTQYMLVYTILNTGLQPSNTVTFHSNISIFDFLPYLLLQHTLNTKYKTQNIYKQPSSTFTNIQLYQQAISIQGFSQNTHLNICKNICLNAYETVANIKQT